MRGAWGFVVIALALSSLGQLAMKHGVNQSRAGGGTITGFLWASIRSPSVAAGVAAYGVSLLCWLLAMRSLPLSVLYPLVSVTYVVVAVGAVVLFGESLSPLQAAGIAIIGLGVVLLARS